MVTKGMEMGERTNSEPHEQNQSAGFILRAQKAKSKKSLRTGHFALRTGQPV